MMRTRALRKLRSRLLMASGLWAFALRFNSTCLRSIALALSRICARFSITLFSFAYSASA